MRDEQERLTKDRKDRERLQQVKLLRENEQLDNIRLEAEQVERTKKEREAANSLEQDEIQTKKTTKKNRPMTLYLIWMMTMKVIQYGKN